MFGLDEVVGNRVEIIGGGRCFEWSAKDADSGGDFVAGFGFADFASFVHFDGEPGDKSTFAIDLGFAFDVEGGCDAIGCRIDFTLEVDLSFFGIGVEQSEFQCGVVDGVEVEEFGDRFLGGLPALTDLDGLEGD